MACDGLAANESRRGTAGHLGSGDDNVGVSSRAHDQIAAPVESFFAKFGGIAPAAFGIDAAEIHVEKLCAERTDLFPGSGAHVVRLNHRAQAAGRGDGLQAGYTCANDEDLCRRNGSRGSHQHRETGAAELPRR